MTLKLFLAENGEPGELIDNYEGSEFDLIRFCYENWQEYQDYQLARADWSAARKRGEKNPSPFWEGGLMPFAIQRPDGTWVRFERELSSAERDERDQEGRPKWNENDEEDEDDGNYNQIVTLNKDVKCQRLLCRSHRVADVYGKCSGNSSYTLGDKDRDGYLPSDMGVCYTDEITFSYCLDCGQIQGTWPLPRTKFELGTENEY
jgi:hypothetical protein